MSIENITADAVIVPFIFDASYKGDSLTRKVCDILGCKDIQSWSVIDTSEHLALVHYNDDSDMTTYGHLRGVLVDVEVGAIIANSFGYTPTAVSDNIILDNGTIAIKDKDGINHTFSDEYSIKRIFEGVVVRVIWHKGKLYRITHKKINPIRSRWGTSKSFISMYEDAGGPTAEQLFDTTKPYSNTCYHFLVVSPELLVATRQRVSAPYIICIAQQTMDINRPVEEVAVGIPSFATTDKVGGVVNKSVIHNPKNLTVTEANQHLNFGYYNNFKTDDSRQLTGEAVIIYKMQNGMVTDVVKVHSQAYEWRNNLRGNNPNIVYQFYALLNSTYGDISKDKAWANFKDKFVLLPLYDVDSLKALYSQTQGILTIPSGEVARDDYSGRDSRIHLLWMNYVLSLPANLQGDALNILDNFKQDRKNLASWLATLESTNKNIEALEYSARIKGILTISRKLAKERVAEGKNYSAKGSIIKLPMLIKSTIYNLLNKENGPSLYALVREMKKPPKVVENKDAVVSENTVVPSENAVVDVVTSENTTIDVVTSENATVDGVTKDMPIIVITTETK